MNVVILVLALVSLGGSVPSRPSHAMHSATTPHRAPDQQRVWSNDDLKYLRENAPISIIGSTQPALLSAPEAESSAAAPAPCATYVREDDPLWYSSEIELRRAAIAEIDHQLNHIASVEAGGVGISNAFPFEGTNPGIGLPGTVYELQEQAHALQTEIDALQDLAQSREIPREAWR